MSRSDKHIFAAEPQGQWEFFFGSHGVDAFKLNGRIVESICAGMRG